MITSSLKKLYYDTDEDGMAPMDHLDPNYDLSHSLYSVHSWRGLFDSGSCEYNFGRDISKEDNIGEGVLERKWQVIEKLKKFLDCGFDGLIYLVAKDWNTEYCCYRLSAIPWTVWHYSKKYREAEVYLMRCKHPLFKEFSSKFSKNWKVSIRERMERGNQTFSEKSLKLFLLDSKLPKK